MNIIHLTPYVPSLKASHAGGVLMGKEFEWLCKNHTVTLFTFVNDEYEEELLKEFTCPYEAVKSSTFNKIMCGLSAPSMPLFFGIRKSSEMKKKLISRLSKGDIDAVHVEYTAMGQYIDLKRQFPNIKFVLTEHDVTRQSYERQLAVASGLQKIWLSFELSRVKACEAKFCASADTVISFSKKDCLLLDKLYDLKEPAVHINPYYGVDSLDNAVCGPANKICFVGQMGRAENEEAALRLIQIFKNNHLVDKAELVIIGAHPSDALKNAAKGIATVTGFVEDINQEIKKCGLAVFPLNCGAGIKLKVLLAASLGLPVITSDVGAEGIDEEGKAVFLCDSDEDFANAILDLVNNPETYEIRKKSIKNLVDQEFSWDMSEKIFSQLYPISTKG